MALHGRGIDRETLTQEIRVKIDKIEDNPKVDPKIVQAASELEESCLSQPDPSKVPATGSHRRWEGRLFPWVVEE